ncbi:MAG: hypothetical protein AAB697_02065 [Patescibacteria group bacterium]
MIEIPLFTVSGIDGSGKSSAVDGVSKLLVDDKQSVGVLSSSGTISYVYSGREKKPIYLQITQKITALYKAGQESGNHMLVLASLFEYLLLRERFIRPCMEKLSLDCIVGDRDPFVDSIVLLESYLRINFPPRVMAKTLESIIGNHPARILFLLNISPEVAFARRKSETGNLDIHERPDRLKRMSERYIPTITAMERCGKVSEHIEINTEESNRSHVVGEIYSGIISTLK